MPILQHDGRLLVFRLTLTPREVEGLLDLHKEQYENTEEIEDEARELKRSSFPEAASMKFVDSVYKWSKVQRNLRRVNESGSSKIAKTLRDASQLIDHCKEPGAIQTLLQIPQLGVSYASKIARFLDPDKCVILDSIIRERLGYSNDIHGYAAFLEDCREALKMLKTSPILDSEFRARLRVCDVEAALFMKAKELNNVSP